MGRHLDFANHRALSDHKTVVEFNKLIVFIIKSIMHTLMKAPLRPTIH